MKKVAILSIVLVLLVVSVVPVMAKGPNNGHGNGVGTGQGNPAGSSSGDRDQVRQQNHDGASNNGARGNGNHGQNRMRTPFYLQGVISAVDTTAKTLTVTLIHGNAKVKEYIGTDLTLQATVATLIFKITQGDEAESEIGESRVPGEAGETSVGSDESDTGRVPITFDQLAVGQKVAIHGNLVDGVYLTRLITVYLEMPIGESTGG